MRTRIADSEPEHFVSAEEAAEFLGIKRRLLLAMARRGVAGAYPVGTGDVRRHWIFKLSELSRAISPSLSPIPVNQTEERRRPVSAGTEMDYSDRRVASR